MAAVAAAFVSPSTFGTVTDAELGPVEMTMLTAEPVVTVAAAAGFSLITFPEMTVLLDC
jgi:hypothetical protein